MPFRCARGPFAGNEEPTVEALLSEPIVRMVMARDQVEEAELRRIISEFRTRSREYGRLPTGAQGPHSPTD